MNEERAGETAPLVILHVFGDSIFFDSVSDFFDSLPNVKNLYYYYTKDANYEFKYIRRSIDKIRIVDDYKEYIKCFSDPSVDIIYFYNLDTIRYRLFNYIDKNKKVIWWEWGFDIYHYSVLPPIVKIELFKPLTKAEVNKNKIENKNKNKIKNEVPLYKKFLLYKVCRFLYYAYLRNKVLKRVDYFSPVLPIEYTLMQNNPHFRAKPFMLGGPGKGESMNFTCFHSPQNILVGHSLTYTDNHLDIFAKIKNFSLNGQKYIIPISYGPGYNGDHEGFKARSGLSNEDTIWLDEFLPREQYASLINTVSHAIFGCLRQAAMGNISMCLRRSVKIFLYKDSLVYKQLKEWGYVVYTIDDDLSEEALRSVLPEELAFHNYSLKNKINEERLRSVEQIYSL